MLSSKMVDDLKQQGYSFEEIQRITKGLQEIDSGKVLSKKQVKHFIDTKLFSKYSVNV